MIQNVLKPGSPFTRPLAPAFAGRLAPPFARPLSSELFGQRNIYPNFQSVLNYCANDELRPGFIDTMILVARRTFSNMILFFVGFW